MPLENPPLYLQARIDHPAERFRRILAPILGAAGAGVGSEPTSLQVSERGAGANMSVDIDSGVAYLQDTGVTPGFYVVQNEGVENVAIAPADPTNPRIDLIICRIQDSVGNAPDLANESTFEVVVGTPGPSPVAPAIPGGYVATPLAEVTVPAGAVSILDADIADARVITPISVQDDLTINLGGTGVVVGGGVVVDEDGLHLESDTGDFASDTPWRPMVRRPEGVLGTQGSNGFGYMFNAYRKSTPSGALHVLGAGGSDTVVYARGETSGFLVDVSDGVVEDDNVNSLVNAMQLRASDGAVLFPTHRTTGSGASAVLTTGGELQRSTSARRYKKDIVPLSLQRCRDFLESVTGVSFKSKLDTDAGRIVGLIADDVAETFPEVVTYTEDNKVDGLQYDRVVPILLELVRDLSDRIAELEDK